MFAGMMNTPSVTYAELKVRYRSELKYNFQLVVLLIIEMYLDAFIQSATDDFDSKNVIGRGGYGIVYRGEWKQNQVRTMTT